MAFDKELFADLLKKAKGDRSINQYALHSGVSAAHISRLMRGLLDTPPNPDTIKLLSEKAYNGVTYEDLMAAAGHVNVDSKSECVDNDWNSKLPELTPKEEKDIARDLERMLNALDSENGYAAFDGRDIEEMDEEDKELLKASLENSLRLAKRLAKQKFTPKKYRK